MVKNISKILLIIFISFLLGLCSTFLALNIYRLSPWGVTHNKNWATNLFVGSTEAGMYVRAIVAAFGTLALNASEAIYWGAEKDNDGNPIDDDCTYKIVGKGDLHSRWWNITLYRNTKWMPNALNRYSYSKTNVDTDKDGQWTIRISKVKQKGNWLPVDNNSGPMGISLRLYHPQPSVIENIKSVELPKIIREECR